MSASADRAAPHHSLATVEEHTFENLIIALCPTDHARVENCEIDRKALRMYKANLSILNSRYSDFERRVLDEFALAGAQTIDLANADFQLMYLLRDGLLVDLGSPTINGVQRTVNFGGAIMSPRRYALTESGSEFMERWINGGEIK